MKKLITLLAATFVLASAYAGEFADISLTEVKALTESKTAVIIDVNGSDSYKEGHVPTALNFAAIEDKLAASLPADKNTLIVAYCGNPKCPAYLRAAKAVKKLGYNNVKHMAEGISGWKSAGLKTE